MNEVDGLAPAMLDAHEWTIDRWRGEERPVTGARCTVHYLVCDRHNRELGEARRYLRWTALKP
jgi:hypothetical protein